MIRIIFAIILGIMATVSIHAQDVIVKRSGDEIKALVQKVSETEIEYKKWSNKNGPSYSMPKNEIFMIKYANGEKDIFDESNTTSSSTTNGGNQKKAAPAEDNEKQKSQYAVLPNLNLNPSNKKTKDFFPIMAFTESSVISTKELTIIIEPNAVEYYDGGWKVKIGYAIVIVNKTDKPIYIDRANCFRRFNDYDTKCYFDNKQITVSHGNNSGIGVGVGIGPISIGSGASSGSSHSENYGVERFLAIGLRSKANLMDYKYIRLSEKKAKFRTVSDLEYNTPRYSDNRLG